MDSSITLSYGSRTTSTIVSNTFIDKYMTDARGSDVKVYIYLLRCLQNPTETVSIESIAEALDETEKDIRTALKYWDKQHVLSVQCARNGKIKNITLHDLDEDNDDDHNSDPFESESNITILADSHIKRKSETQVKAAPDEILEKPNYSVQTIQTFKDDYPDFEDLIDYIEQVLGKTLTQRDLQTPAFIFEVMDFPTELISFLYDYCVGKGKRSNAYIEKVAKEWHSKGIRTVSDAMIEIEDFSNRYSAVKSSFAINRSFGDAELEFVKRWYHEYHFSDEIIKEACSRALLATSRPSFEYADKILSDWYKKGIKTLEDVKAASAAFQSQSQSSARRGIRNSSLQYSQRSYSDAEISAIEKKKLGIL